MGTHWNAGLMRWRPHVDPMGERHTLDHLHPIRFVHALKATNNRPEAIVTVHVGFGLHCFTRKCSPTTERVDTYRDKRETREFDPERYRLSTRLPGIVTTLHERPCAFGRHDNYVTVDLANAANEEASRYAVFFNVRRWHREGPSALLLVVQSAYPLEQGKGMPTTGRIAFNALLGHALRGTQPHPPR